MRGMALEKSHLLKKKIVNSKPSSAGFAIYSSTVKISSIETLNTFAAKSSCFILNLALYSLILFLIIGYTTSIFPVKTSSNEAKKTAALNFSKPPIKSIWN